MESLLTVSYQGQNSARNTRNTVDTEDNMFQKNNDILSDQKEGFNLNFLLSSSFISLLINYLVIQQIVVEHPRQAKPSKCWVYRADERLL